MKIALINENSQNSKNPMIEAALKKVVEPMGHTVFMRPLVDVLGEIDQDLVKGALAGEHFQEYFFANATDEAIIAKVKELLGL